MLNSQFLSKTAAFAAGISGLVGGVRAENYIRSTGDLGGSVFSIALGVSDDGNTVSGWGGRGTGYDEAFVWTPDDGIRGLGDFDGGQMGSIGYAVSGNGRYAVGTANDGYDYPNDQFINYAFRWSEEDGLVSLGDFSGGSRQSEAMSVSGDGDVVAGYGTTGRGMEAFRWTPDSGMNKLPDWKDKKTYAKVAEDVSRDGKFLVGRCDNSTRLGYRWSEETGFDLVEGFHKSFPSWPTVVSADGSIVAGFGYHPSYKTDVAFRWTEDGIEVLGKLSENWESSRPTGISDDGSIIVGNYDSDDGFVWDRENGMRSLVDVLQGAGVDLSGWDPRILQLQDVSGDGRTFVGQGWNYDTGLVGFVAHIPEPSAAVLLLVAAAAGLRRR